MLWRDKYELQFISILWFIFIFILHFLLFIDLIANTPIVGSKRFFQNPHRPPLICKRFHIYFSDPSVQLHNSFNSLDLATSKPKISVTVDEMIAWYREAIILYRKVCRNWLSMLCMYKLSDVSCKPVIFGQTLTVTMFGKKCIAEKRWM